MTIHHFPGSTNTLGRRIREASADCRSWRSVVRQIAERFPGARCEIVFLRRPSAAPALRLAGTRGAIHVPDGLDLSRLEAGWRVGEAVRIADGGTRGDNTEGSSLLLRRTATGAFVLHLRSAASPERRQGEAMTALLTRLSPVLVPAFRLSLELAEGAPAREDLETNWDPLDYGAILLMPWMKPSFANVAAEEMLGVRSLFRPMGRGGALRTASTDVQDELESAVDRIASGALSRATIELPHPAGRVRLLMRVWRAGEGLGGGIGSSGGDAGRVVLTLHPQEVARPMPVPPNALVLSDHLHASGF